MSTRSHSVLIIEDFVEMHEIYSAYLAEAEDVKFEVTFATTGAEAFAALRRANFDCVLLDYNLPDTDGLSFLRKLKIDLKSTTPVIMVTGQGHERVAVNALKAGASDYLIKGDVTFETLRDAIVAAIQRQRDAVILGEAREILIVKQQNVIDRQKRELQAFEIEMMDVEEIREIH